MGKEESGLRKILIVEDDKVLNKTLAYNLTADGYEVTSAYSFQDAVERLGIMGLLLLMIYNGKKFLDGM